ncbi:MAG TPA: monovalent cation/H(+) antiporter subunit G [Longimicrobiaceae bacterium]|nr:monovalent cation/H(+) antiporter subunit G [Longimicrobiaceae bacterium]
MIQDIASWGFILTGAFFLLVAGTGMIRMPDVFTRMHAAGIADTAGADLILTGLIIQSGFTLISAKLIIIIGFLMFTSPISTHSVARAALQGGLSPLLSEDPDGDSGKIS